MNTASTVAVIRLLFGKCRTVCMTADQDDMISFCIGLQPSFRNLFFSIIFGGTGGIKDSVMFQGSPNITYKKAGK